MTKNRANRSSARSRTPQHLAALAASILIPRSGNRRFSYDFTRKLERVRSLKVRWKPAAVAWRRPLMPIVLVV